jgi:hypothetical protein
MSPGPSLEKLYRFTDPRSGMALTAFSNPPLTPTLSHAMINAQWISAQQQWITPRLQKNSITTG